MTPRWWISEAGKTPLPSWRSLSPGGKTLAALDALACLALMLSMPAGSWWRRGLWLVAGLAVDFLYGWRTGRFKEVICRE